MVSGQASASSLPHGKTSALNRAATNPRRPRTTQLNRRVGGWSTGRLRRREAICCAGSRSPEDPWRNFSSAWQPTLTVQTWATAIASQSRSTRLASCILLWCQPQRPRLKSLKPVSIQVRIPYQLTSASSGSRSVSTAQADSYPASQCMSNVHFRRLPFPAKHSTVPFQLVPGVGVHRLIQSNVSSPTARALTPRLIRKNGCHPQSMITWNNQRAYSPRSTITSTCQSAGMLPSRCVSKPSQCCRIQNQHQLSVPVSPQTHDPLQQRRKARGHIQFPPLFPAFVFRVQIPLAQALEHRLFLLFQHQGEQSTDLRNPCYSRKRDP